MKRIAFLALKSLIIFLLCTCNKSSAEVSFPFEVSISGQGLQSIIFIPGFACSGDVWKETKSIFENDYKCYSLTMAGFAGVNPKPNPSFQNWENAIADYIRINNIEQPIIIGHSMGGGLAMALASDYPKLISKIIVVDALPCLSALTNHSFKIKENTDCRELITQITSPTNEQFYQMQKQTINQLLADTSKQDLVISWSMKSDRRTFAELYCDYTNTDLRGKISTIKCPSLVLLQSYFINFRTAINEQFTNLQTANIQYATKGLHFIMYDDQEWYTKQLKSFIKQ